MNEIEKIKGSISFMNEWKQVWISELAKNYMDTAIQAMEEKLERKSGCEICNSDEIKKLLIKNVGYNGDNKLCFAGGNCDYPKDMFARYCPKCGRKLDNAEPKHIGEATNMVEGE